MAGETDGAGAPLSHTRQVTIDALCEHFANDVMAVEEFERRVDRAHRATTTDELKALLRDLPGGEVPAVREPTRPVARHDFSPVDPARIRDQGFVLSVLGGAKRRGHWTPARRNYSLAVCGGQELDFRDAQLGPGVTDVKVLAVCGGVDIIVPPGLNVESHGFAILGGFEHKADSTRMPDPNAPVLRVSGFACMGGVDVTVRLPGESARDARRRRRLERKERRRLSKGE